MGVMERSQVEKVPRCTAACKVDPRARRAFHISSVLLAEREIPISEHRPLELPFADLLDRVARISKRTQ